MVCCSFLITCCLVMSQSRATAMPSPKKWPEPLQSLPAGGQCCSAQGESRCGETKESTYLGRWRKGGRHGLSVSWASLKGAFSLRPRLDTTPRSDTHCERDGFSLPTRRAESPRLSNHPHPMPPEDVMIFCWKCHQGHLKRERAT